MTQLIHDEEKRVAALKRYDVLDTPPEEVFDRLTRVASTALGMPMAAVSLVDTDRVWFKSRVGIVDSQVPRNKSFTAYAIQNQEIFVVADILEDARFQGNDVLKDRLKMRFYAGAPIITHDGYCLGALCVFDKYPHNYMTGHGLQLLQDLANIALDELELRQSHAVARQLTQAKTEFLANMSHEIRTPLNGVLTTAELLRETKMDDLQRRYVTTIYNSGELLRTLVDDILDFSKLGAGKLKLHLERISLRELMERLTDLYRAAAMAKGLELIAVMSPDMPDKVLADQQRLFQVLSNLISNAIKYTLRGQVRLSFSIVQDRGKPLVRVIVEDTGKGIPAKYHKLIFDQFTQVGRSAAISGTGLGLAICQSLVAIMKGDLHVESEEGVGSKFIVHVPFIAAQSDEEIVIQEVKSVVRNHANCRVLLVEDIEANRFVIGQMLSLLGCIVDTAENGMEGLEKASSNDYHIIFMDGMMPVMDGIDATMALRARGDQRPIIGITAHALPEEVKKFKRAGMNEVVIKPVRKNELALVLDRWHATTEVPNERVSDNREAVQEKAKDVHDANVGAVKPVPVLDGFLKSVFDKNPSAGEKLIALTIKDAVRLERDIIHGLDTQNMAGIAAAAHALKSVSGQVGDTDLADMCRRLELAAKADDKDLAHSLRSDFEQFYAIFMSYLERFKVTTSSSLSQEGGGL